MEEYDDSCDLCGAPDDMDCHPNCPNAKLRNDMPDFFEYLNDIIVKSADEFFTRQHARVEKKIVTERMGDFIKDWKEVATFLEAMKDAGYFRKIDDVLHFLRKPDSYSPAYLLWLELNKPKKEDKAEFNIFRLELLNRRK